jgi:hypothetical protein
MLFQLWKIRHLGMPPSGIRLSEIGYWPLSIHLNYYEWSLLIFASGPFWFSPGGGACHFHNFDWNESSSPA